jgi:hypothetical protein
VVLDIKTYFVVGHKDIIGFRQKDMFLLDIKTYFVGHKDIKDMIFSACRLFKL